MIRSRTLSLFAALALAAAAPAAAVVPPDSVLSGFQPSGEYVFLLGGEKPAGLELYYSERAVAYLVMAPSLSSPLLINPRTRSVEKVHLMKVAKRPDGSVDLLADAVLDPVGSFRLDGQSLVFELGGETATLMPKPDLLGSQTAAVLLANDVAYGRGAEEYVPSGAAIQALRRVAQPVEVRVYFGSWCPACRRLVPRVLSVERALAGTPVRFTYYGLPHDITSDPESERMDVHGVPTAVVLRGGREVGRLVQNDWNAPERSLLALLQGS